jgi:hypothetical protein
MAKRTVICLIFGVFLVFGARANMISFLVVETGLTAEGERRLHSENWENALMNEFYEAGFIVCNSPKVRFEKMPEGDMADLFMVDFYEARQGSVDYFIIVQLDYLPGVMTSKDISFFLYKLNPYKNIYEKKITGRTYRNVNEEINDLQSIIRGLIPYIK